MSTPWPRHNQLLFVYGTGLGFGLHLGLVHLAITRSWGGALFVVVAALIYSTLTLALWKWVLPHFAAQPLPRRLVYQSLATLVCMTLLSVALVEAYSLLLGEPSLLRPYAGPAKLVTLSPERIRRAPLVYALIPIVPTVVLCVVGFNQHWWRILTLQGRQRELQELAVSAQLAALRARVHPHFLFNSLNSIAQLISSDPAKAEVCVERLAEILRYLLSRAHTEFVPLADELEIAEAYLEIERARFGDNLRVEERIDERARCVLLPGLILQPLVENAVKHGISRKIGGGEVCIEARLDNGHLRLVVMDTGLGVADGPPVFERGVGLRSVRDRLLRLYGSAYEPTITSRPGAGTTVALRIPVRSASA
jgi:signal transduction histidine kinase